MIHGHARRADGRKLTPTYRSWEAMMARCHRKTHRQYAEYGGRGIIVCERWHDFVNFLADMGERPKGHTIDRKKNELGYSPDNCRWATSKQQTRNRSTNNNVTHDGLTLCLSDWAARSGMTYALLRYRLNQGWDFARAIGTPVKTYRKRTAA